MQVSSYVRTTFPHSLLRSPDLCMHLCYELSVPIVYAFCLLCAVSQDTQRPKTVLTALLPYLR